MYRYGCGRVEQAGRSAAWRLCSTRTRQPEYNSVNGQPAANSLSVKLVVIGRAAASAKPVRGPLGGAEDLLIREGPFLVLKH